METLRRGSRVLARGVLPPLQHLPQPPQLPGFELEFLSAGKTFMVVVRARNTQAAQAEGRLQLASAFPDFDDQDARLVAFREVR